MRIGIRMRLILLLLLIIGCGDEPIKNKTYEIKDEITGKIHIFKKEPKLKKNVMFYCLNDEEHKVIWIDWHPNQTPEYTYQVDSYENYMEKTWWEQHYGYRIAP